MRRFLSADMTKDTVADGLLVVNPQWMSRANLSLDVSRAHSFILGSGALDEYYIAASKGVDVFRFSITRTTIDGGQTGFAGECAPIDQNVELEINGVLSTLRAWQTGELPDEEPDPVPPEMMTARKTVKK